MNNQPRNAVVDRILARCVRDGDCVVWQGSTTRGGYGQTTVHGKRVSVHRAIYEQRYGQIPGGLQIDHVKARGCHSRACCNADHLEAVTARVNVLSGDTITAANAIKTHCLNGHPLAGENLVRSYARNGRRQCRICTNRWRAERPATISNGSEAWHGTVGGYSNHKCRCERCRDAHSAYLRLYGPTRRARGLCWSCNTPVTDGRTRCPKHLVLAALADKRYQERAVAILDRWRF